MKWYVIGALTDILLFIGFLYGLITGDIYLILVTSLFGILTLSFILYVRLRGKKNKPFKEMMDALLEVPGYDNKKEQNG